MGNIVTPDQGLLPLPGYGGVINPYPWWLNTALAIWALLALLCCWLLMLLYLLRYCCRWCRQREYAAHGKALREDFFGSGNARGGMNTYGADEYHFATAPLPPIPAYALHGGSDGRYRDVHERHIVEDDFYGNMVPYVTAAGADNEGFETGSEFISEEEIQTDNINEKVNGIRLVTKSRRPVTVISDQLAGDVTENIETNIQRNITKNYYINEEQNYFIQKEVPAIETTTQLHDQEVQRLPGPTVTTVNMAAERIADNPNWENATVKEDFNNQNVNKASAEIIKNDPSLFKHVKYENQPNIYTHQPVIPEILNTKTKKLGRKASITTDDASITSEMSGHDSESIYETIRVLTPRKELVELEEDDEYKTAGFDEVEIAIKDLVLLQKANGDGGNYDDIVASTTMSRQQLIPRVSSLSSSSTLNNMVIPVNEQGNMANDAVANEEKEETVTETVTTQQIQTTFRQIGQNLDGSAFFIPLTSAIAYQGEQQEEKQQNPETKIIVPVSIKNTPNEEQRRFDDR